MKEDMNTGKLGIFY